MVESDDDAVFEELIFKSPDRIKKALEYDIEGLRLQLQHTFKGLGPEGEKRLNGIINSLHTRLAMTVASVLEREWATLERARDGQ